MKKVWLVQPTKLKDNTIYLPYTIGTIAAYSWQFEEIKTNYSLQDFIFFMDDIDLVLQKVDSPYLMAFSSYMWNVNYNLMLAEAIKKKYPECLVVFGGPDVPENASFLEQYSFVDFLIFGEGEEPFYQLLTALEQNKSLSEVTSIAYRKDGEIVLNTIVTPEEIWDYPSPYTGGYFDHILQNPANKNIQFDMVFESNRGCPYHCLYCSWGMKTGKIRQLDMKRVKGDIDWAAKNKIIFMICCDGNFGIFDRDEEIIDHIVACKKEFGYPHTAEIIAAKNKDDFVFKIIKKLNDAGLNRGISIACQSMSDEVLKIINRKNMSMVEFSEQVRKYRKANIQTYTDMIVGLPGETFESFCKGIFEVYEAGQDFLTVFLCELLPCAPMAQPEVIKKYGIKTVKSGLCQFHTNIYEDAMHSSRSEMVVETNTMTRLDWVNMNIVVACAQAFHGYGLTKFVANFLHRTQGVTYYEFYMDFFRFMREDNRYTMEIIEYANASLYTFIQGKSSVYFFDKRFGDIYLELYEGVFACFAADKDEFYSQIKPYLKRFFTDNELFEDLMLYQISKITFPYTKAHTEDFEYDWEDYFSDIYNVSYKQPKRGHNTLEFDCKYFEDLKIYVNEIVWLGKRTGKAFVPCKRIKNKTMNMERNEL